MSIVGLTLIILGTIFSFFGTFFSDEKSQKELTSKIQEKNEVIDDINNNNIRLIDQNTSLIESNNDVIDKNKNLLNQNVELLDANATVFINNKELIKQNSEMLSKISNYQSEIEIRNKKIEVLEKKVSEVKRYNYVSVLDITGREVPNGDIVFSSPLTNLMDQILEKKDNMYVIKTDLKSLAIMDQVINKFPNFPFGYYAKAKSLRLKNDNSWRDFATKGIEILEITTSISGHHQNHDEALKALKEWMRN